MDDIGIIQEILKTAKELGIGGVLLSAILLKKYVINGSIDRFFKTKTIEIRLQKRLLNSLLRLEKLHLDDGKKKEEKQI